jgi:UDPglucose 6-dehydrogenase
LRSVIEINTGQRHRTLHKVRDALGGLEMRRIAIFGAAFKAHTDDTRNSPALELASLLRLEGAEVAIYDPVVPASRIESAVPGVVAASSCLDAAREADAIVVATDWPEFTGLDFVRLGKVVAQHHIVDARNVLDPEAVRRAGFEYHCIGRPGNEGGPIRVPAVAVAAGGGQ